MNTHPDYFTYFCKQKVKDCITLVNKNKLTTDQLARERRINPQDRVNLSAKIFNKAFRFHVDRLNPQLQVMELPYFDDIASSVEMVNELYGFHKQFFASEKLVLRDYETKIFQILFWQAGLNFSPYFNHSLSPSFAKPVQLESNSNVTDRLAAFNVLMGKTFRSIKAERFHEVVSREILKDFDDFCRRVGFEPDQFTGLRGKYEEYFYGKPSHL
jgi:hypothetical protein